MTTIQKKEERGSLLLVFSSAACVRKHLNGVRDRECCICLEREALGILEDEEFTAIWENGTYRIRNEVLDDKKPHYYQTGNRERLLMLLSKEPETLESGKRLLLSKEEALKVGNAYQNRIFYDCFSLSEPQMAEIIWKKDGYVLCPAKDEGIYLNEKAVREETILHTGDRIDIYGFHMMLLNDMLICGCRIGVWRIAGAEAEPEKLVPERRRVVKEEIDIGDNACIERYCRQEESLHEGEVEILLPEPVSRENTSPLLLTLGPSVTMVMPMLLMAWLGSRLTGQTGQTGINFYLLSAVMGICSAFLAFFWGITNHIYRKRRKKREERERVNQYREYLNKTRENLLLCGEENRKILERRYPPAATFFGKAGQPARVAWNRYFRNPDFLFLRMGLGETDFQIHVKLSGSQKRIVDDKLTENAREMIRELKTLKDIPEGVDFLKVRELGILGEIGEQQVQEILFQLLVQLAACHCYTEVKLTCFYRKEKDSHRRLAEGIRWLHHSWSSDEKVRFLAGDEREAAQIIPILQQELERGAEEKESGLPWYFILVLNEELLRGEVLYQYLLEPDGKYPVSAVFVKRTGEELPKSCRYYLKAQERMQEAVIYGEEQVLRKQIFLERVCGPEAEEYFREIAGLHVKEIAVKKQLPDQVSFLQLFGCAKITELACAGRWKKNNPGERLKVPIGAGTGGNPVWLDVHEKFHGPHGLIAGTTGSGKSELLQTYLLSLSVNYSPEAVNFFMIDYKGGGTGNLLRELPHCAGVISNLSGKQVKRAISAIISENKRRQQLLGNFGVNHINAYTQLYRDGIADEPMPHLLLVVDEFAQLRREEPEFMQDIVSLAQVGRSLGVHLILATQKPAGTVDERIWSNARFRLCLRVQDKQDSLDVLHNTDAAMLTLPGQCYLQIGNHEYYELFQTGYCGEPYREETGVGSGAVLIENTGIRRHVNNKEKQRNGQSQLEAVIDYVNQIARQEGYQGAGSLWMPELPELLYLDDFAENEKKEEISLLLGYCDDPENQRQFPLWYCPKEQGHLLICGGPATGKTSLLHTILWQLCTACSPKEALILTVDTGQGSLDAFTSMPCCMGTLKGGEEPEIFFYHMKRFVEDRRKTLSGVSAQQYNKLRKGILPYVFLVVDNFGSFFRNLKEGWQEFLIRLAAEGIHCGIYLILTGTAPGEVPGKLCEKIKTTLAFEMSDRFAYGDVLRQYYIPVLPKENTRGRGLCKVEGRILEFQAALPIKAPDEYARMKQIEKTGRELSAKWREMCRQQKEEMYPKIFPRIPEEPSYEMLREAYSWENRSIPLGYSLTNGEIIGLKINQSSCFIVSGAIHTGREAVLAGIAEGLLYREETVILIDRQGMTEHLIRKKEAIWFLSEEEEILALYEKLPEEACILISDLTGFCSLIYRFDEQRKERVAFWEDIVQGRKKGIFLVGGYTPARDYEAEATGFFREICEQQTGIHLGGNAAGQHIFDFEDLGYAGMNRYESTGVGYYKKGPGSRTQRILLPIEKEERDDFG